MLQEFTYENRSLNYIIINLQFLLASVYSWKNLNEGRLLSSSQNILLKKWNEYAGNFICTERMLSNLAVRNHFMWSASLLATESYPVMFVWLFAGSSPPGLSVRHVAAGKPQRVCFLCPTIITIWYTPYKASQHQNKIWWNLLYTLSTPHPWIVCVGFFYKCFVWL
jgi:hypothetical protein